MTKTQRLQVARATAIAQRDGLTSRPHVIPGTARSGEHSGERVFAVYSRSGSEAAQAPVYHLLTIDGPRIRCQCRAAAFGRVCCHAAAVRDLLLAETAAKTAEISARAADARWYDRYLADNYPPNLGYK